MLKSMVFICMFWVCIGLDSTILSLHIFTNKHIKKWINDDVYVEKTI